MRFRLRARWCVWVIACAVLLGCKEAATVQPDTPQLRITNASEFIFDRVVVIFPQEQITFEAVAPGATTAYQPVPGGVYRYAAYEMTFDGRKIRQPVIDWVGEVPMAGNAFTYVLSFDPQQPEFSTIQHKVHQD